MAHLELCGTNNLPPPRIICRHEDICKARDSLPSTLIICHRRIAFMMPSANTRDYLSPCGIIYHSMRSSVTPWNRLPLGEVICHHLRSSTTSSCRLPPPDTICYCLGSASTPSGYCLLRMFVIQRDHLPSSGITGHSMMSLPPVGIFCQNCGTFVTLTAMSLYRV